MQKKLLTLLLLGAALFLSACMIGGGQTAGGVTVLPSVDLESDDDEDRRAGTSGRCEEYGSCIDTCEDVYDNDEDDAEAIDAKIDRCVELSYNTAIQFEDILETLEDPTTSGLKNIKSSVFSRFLEVSLDPWVEQVADVSNSEAEALLAWVAGERGISSAIKKAYQNNYEDRDKYEGLLELFNNIGSDHDCALLRRTMCSHDVAGDRSFMDVANDTNNSNAISLAEDILEEKCDPMPASVCP